MQHEILYKKLTAAFFLLLYTFIAIPVQCWHQHTFHPQQYAVVKKYHTIIKSGFSDDCKICQHTYTAYLNDGLQQVVIDCSETLSEYLHYSSSITVTIFGYPDNKSPPQI